MFLLVYVHSRMHDDTESFLRNVLCKQDIKDFIDENFVCYLGSINKPEAFSFVQTLGITGDSRAAARRTFDSAAATCTNQLTTFELPLLAYPWLGIVHQASSTAPVEVLQWKEGAAGERIMTENV